MTTIGKDVEPGPYCARHPLRERCAQWANRAWARLLSTILMTLAVSFVCQWALYHGPADDLDRGMHVTPDSQSYVNLAKCMGTRDAPHVVLFRTPGLPLMLRAVAWLRGIDISQVDVTLLAWDRLSEESRRFVLAVIAVNRVLGLFIPVLIFLAMHLLTESKVLSFLCSLVYIADVTAVTYQDVFLTETPSVFFFWVSIACAVLVFKRPSASTGLLYGVATGCLALVRPSFLPLPFLLVPVLAIRMYVSAPKPKARSIRGISTVLASVAAPFCLTIGTWCLHNHLITGHPVFTQGTAYTLPNFSTRYFVNMPVEDPELVILQRHLREWHVKGQGYAHIGGAESAIRELKCDRYRYNRLLMASSSMAIRANPGDFVSGAWVRFLEAWNSPLRNVRNRRAVENAKAAPILGTLCATEGYLILGERTLVGFVVCMLIAWLCLKQPWQRWLLLYLAAALVSGVALSTALDECEPIRHSLGYRSPANALCVMGVALALAAGLRRLAARGAVKSADNQPV